jgi:D-galactarolactone isomerase
MQATQNTTYDGACDCHVHIYEDKYPMVPNVAWVPPHLPVATYREVQKALGLSRAVIVQPSAYGFDNSCTLDAVAQLGEQGRGIALVAPEVTDAELRRLHDGGICGVRYMMINPVLSWDSLEPMAARLASMDWMVNLQLDGRDFPSMKRCSSACPARSSSTTTENSWNPSSPITPPSSRCCACWTAARCGSSCRRLMKPPRSVRPAMTT